MTFSAASIWEVAIKNGLGRPDFSVDPRVLRRGLLEHVTSSSPLPERTPPRSTCCLTFTATRSIDS